MPISSSPDAVFLEPEDFEERFGFEKPGGVGAEDGETGKMGGVQGEEGKRLDGDEGARRVVFYCKAGVRSRAAAEMARQAGWEGVGEFPGSWVEWVEKGGK